jgi:hypothetical protein
MVRASGRFDSELRIRTDKRGAGPPNGKSSDVDRYSFACRVAERSDPEFEGELDRPWAGNVVTAAAAVLTVVLVSSVAVLMYLA